VNPLAATLPKRRFRFHLPGRAGLPSVISMRPVTLDAGLDGRQFSLGLRTIDTHNLDAIVRRMEIVGEAAKRLSGAFRNSNSQMPWNDMAGMRDRVIHGTPVAV